MTPNAPTHGKKQVEGTTRSHDLESALGLTLFYRSADRESHGLGPVEARGGRQGDVNGVLDGKPTSWPGSNVQRFSSTWQRHAGAQQESRVSKRLGLWAAALGGEIVMR